MMNETGEDKLCNALIRLMEAKTLEEITVKELVATAGVNRSTYNYHFYSIENVFEKVLERFCKGLCSYFIEFKKSDDSKLTGNNVETNCFEYISLKKKEVTTIFRSGYGLRFIDYLAKYIEKFFHNYEMIFFNDEGEVCTLSDGLVYELRLREFANSVGVDIQFWVEYNNIIPMDQMMDVLIKAKHLHMSGARSKF